MSRMSMQALCFLISALGTGLLFCCPAGAEESPADLQSVYLLLSNPCRENFVCRGNEICGDAGAIALDNDCDGAADEGCSCVPGTSQSCFLGDPSFRYAAGCFPGTQECLPFGTWGPCEGGLHATDNCFSNDQSACHALTSRPFVPVDLKTGTGNFSSDAIVENWTVACPADVSPCPAVSGSNPADDFQPLVSGEYTVTYEKNTATGADSCTYPLFVGAPGLRVELKWDWSDSLGTDTVDLDLHLHKPGDTAAWGGNQGNDVDCAWDNCTALECINGLCPTWFSGTAPPDPVSWYLDATFENNTCYFAPRGAGLNWQAGGMGCHNPRLDTDNITCNPSVTDPQNYDYCNAENINIDYPPLNRWTRIGVLYYNNHNQTYDVHPEIKVYCDGNLAATLGPGGFYNPPAPVAFTPQDSETLFWLVADVAFTDTCGERKCIVKPLYTDTGARTPLFSSVQDVSSAFAPPYPPLP